MFCAIFYALYKVLIMEDNVFKCPYCETVINGYNHLCKHVFKEHSGISREQILIDTKYGGVRPTCKCGCGEYTNISYEGGAHFVEYKRGHISRIHNNWGHNPKAVENSAKTRRERFGDGGIIAWNKGKKWEECYDEETIERLRDGIKKTIAKTINSGDFKISSNLETIFIDEFIKPLGIEYKRQLHLKDINQFCDIYIPSKNLVIECDGDFWHANPNYYPTPKYQRQIDKIERDKIKDNYLKEHGYKLLRFWEDDILNDKEMVRTKLNDIIIADN